MVDTSLYLNPLFSLFSLCFGSFLFLGLFLLPLLLVPYCLIFASPPSPLPPPTHPYQTHTHFLLLFILPFNPSFLPPLHNIHTLFMLISLPLSSTIPVVQTLNLDGLNFLTDIGTLAILETCPLLRSLDLDGEMLTDKTAVFIGQTLTQLEHLGISFCSHITDTALQAFSELQRLSSLRLRKGTNFTSQGIEQLFTSRKSRAIRTSHTNSDGVHKRITERSKLTHKWSEKDQESSKNCHENGCTVVEVSDDKNYTLHTLDLSECHDLSDSNLELIAGKIPNLRNIDISWCFKITDSGLESLIKGCINLSSLKLIGLKYAHCEPLFAASLAKLVNLDLSQTDLVDDAKLLQLKRVRPWLKIINYYGEEIISDD